MYSKKINGILERQRNAKKILPAAALRAMSKEQRSYLDEFTFVKKEGGRIDAYYGGELLTTWDGKRWT